MGVLTRRLKRLTQRTKAGAGAADVRQGNGLGENLDVFARPLPITRSEQPEAGSQICEGLTLYHDASGGLFAWQQTADRTLKLTIYQFQGSYLSLAIGIGEQVIRDMRHGGYLGSPG